MGGTLEFIQSLNNPEITDASDISLEESYLHWGWEFLTFTRDLIQLPKLLIKMEHKLFSSSFKVIILVTYWASLLFSEAPLEEVLMCSLSCLQTD